MKKFFLHVTFSYGILLVSTIVYTRFNLLQMSNGLAMLAIFFLIISLSLILALSGFLDRFWRRSSFLHAPLHLKKSKHEFFTPKHLFFLTVAQKGLWISGLLFLTSALLLFFI